MKWEVLLFGGLYLRARDRIEGVRDICETAWHDWPVMVLGLVVRANDLVPEDHPEVAEYRRQEDGRLRREYLRRRWRGDPSEASAWYARELGLLATEADRRNAAADRERLARVSRGGEDGAGVVEDTNRTRG